MNGKSFACSALTAAFAGIITLVFVGTPAPVFQPAAKAAVGEQVLCENRTFSAYARSPFILDWPNPGVRKVIRNCTFRNASTPGILIRAVDNLLVENSTFENIRTNVPGQGVHAIALACSGTCSNIVIRNSTFRFIGADGIQAGIIGRRVSNVTIANNEFVGNAATGENGVDVKGVDGPVRIIGNRVHGFRPCESPKLGGSQDCSGSNGPGIVVHDGAPSGRARNVTVERNEVFDNTFGVIVSTADNISVRNNSIHDNLKIGILVTRSTTRVSVYGNTFSGNGQDMVIQR
jgi:parallel beta-helix repeat protein